MKHAVELFFRIALLAFSWFLWWWAFNTPLSNVMNLSIIVGGVLLVFPLVKIGLTGYSQYQLKSACC
jgi:hypothetical protein